MALCKLCDQFDLHSFAADPHGRRGRQYGVVIEAAAAGCSFCELLIQHVPVEDAPSSLWLHFRLGAGAKKYQTWSGENGLQVNRFWVKSGPRLPSVNESVDFGSFAELYVAADPGIPLQPQHGDRH